MLLRGKVFLLKSLVPGNGDISELVLRLPSYPLWYHEAVCLVRKSEK